MKKQILYILFFLSSFGFAQKTISEVLKKYNNESIPYITSEELAMPKTNAILLDTREFIEFEVSHLKNAIYVGYTDFDIVNTGAKIKDKSAKIVVYCTLGIRSEDVAEKLKSKGFTNVYNLYGGIIDWKNKGFEVYNKQDIKTENIHVCNAFWGQWLIEGKKIYD